MGLAGDHYCQSNSLAGDTPPPLHPLFSLFSPPEKPPHYPISPLRSSNSRPNDPSISLLAPPETTPSLLPCTDPNRCPTTNKTTVDPIAPSSPSFLTRSTTQTPYLAGKPPFSAKCSNQTSPPTGTHLAPASETATDASPAAPLNSIFSPPVSTIATAAPHLLCSIFSVRKPQTELSPPFTIDPFLLRSNQTHHQNSSVKSKIRPLRWENWSRMRSDLKVFGVLVGM